MKKLLFFIVSLFFINNLYSQINAKLMRFMDVSDTQIVFVYGGDIWIMPKSGGTAIQVTKSPGEESWPRFSPDGQSIAYSASYDGNVDIYNANNASEILDTGGVNMIICYQADGKPLNSSENGNIKIAFINQDEEKITPAFLWWKFVESIEIIP